MKQIAITILSIFLLFGCDNPVTKKVKEVKEDVSNMNEAVKEINEMQDEIEQLQQVTPLTNAELKEWLPDEVNGMKRTAFKAGQMSYMKIASVEATYANEDKSKKFNIQIIDGAGELGAAATAGMRMLFSQEFEEEDEYKTRKTVTKKGVKAIEESRKDGSKTSIELMQNDRFYMKATGNNMDVEDTWNAIDELELDNLGG